MSSTSYDSSPTAPAQPPTGPICDGAPAVELSSRARHSIGNSCRDHGGRGGFDATFLPARDYDPCKGTGLVTIFSGGQHGHSNFFAHFGTNRTQGPNGDTLEVRNETNNQTHEPTN